MGPGRALDPELDQTGWAYPVSGDDWLEIEDGSLEPFSGEAWHDGFAMQGSGVVTVEVFDPETQALREQKMYFTLNNPGDLDWKSANGHPTTFGEGRWDNGPAAEIANPEVAQFRALPEPPELKSGVSAAGPPEYRGHLIWAPDLRFTIPGNDQAVIEISDAGGFFPPGSQRFDLWWEDAELGLRWFRDADRLNIPVYIDMPLPPGLHTIPPELLPEPTGPEGPASP